MPKKPIAKVKTAGVSAWDVHLQVKQGPIDFSAEPWPVKLSKWLGTLLTEGASTDIPANITTWVESLEALLPIFQKHNTAKKGSTVFDDVEMLHFLKFSLLQRKNDAGALRHFFCFSTQFDNANGEQEYIDDMYKKYGALMEVIWRHCEGFTQLLVTNPPDSKFPEPPGQGPGIDLSPPFKLSDAFLDLVEANNIDRNEKLCLYNSNRDVSSAQVKVYKEDSAKFGTAKAAAKVARDEIAQGLPCGPILDKLLKSI